MSVLRMMMDEWTEELVDDGVPYDTALKIAAERAMALARDTGILDKYRGGR